MRSNSTSWRTQAVALLAHALPANFVASNGIAPGAPGFDKQIINEGPHSIGRGFLGRGVTRGSRRVLCDIKLATRRTAVPALSGGKVTAEHPVIVSRCQLRESGRHQRGTARIAGLLACTGNRPRNRATPEIGIRAGIADIDPVRVRVKICHGVQRTAEQHTRGLDFRRSPSARSGSPPLPANRPGHDRARMRLEVGWDTDVRGHVMAPSRSRNH